MNVVRYAAAKLLSTVAVLLIITALTYVVFFLMPADPAQLSCGRPCSPDRLAQTREFMGLDAPWWRQIIDFVVGVFAGRTFGEGPAAVQCGAPCFGYSFRLSSTVGELITDRFPVTAWLTAGAAVIWLVIGVGGGVLAALKHRTPIDRLVMGGAVVGVSVPAYLLGLLAILVLGLWLNVVPIGGYVPLTENPLRWAWSLITPWMVLAMLNAANYARVTRGQMLEALSEDYIRTARSKGLTEQKVVRRHALRNVLIPIFTLFGMDLGIVLGGAVLTERVFSLPGLGSLLLDGVAALDLPLLVGITLFSAFLIILANLLVDLAYGLLDPRVRSARVPLGRARTGKVRTASAT